MKLVVTEKNIAAQKIAELLGTGKPKADKVFNTPVYRFTNGGEDWVTIGLRGHILEPDFMPQIIYKRGRGWLGVDAEGQEIPADIPGFLPKPPFKSKRKPFLEKGVDLSAWKMDALPYLAYGPIEKLPKEKDIIRSLKNLAKKADEIIIATDFDREGELIGADALSCIKDVNTSAPVSRARYSAITREEITHAFANLVAVDMNLAQAGESRQLIDLVWGAVLTRYLTIVKFAGYGNVRSSGRVQTPTLALIVARERERMAFIPEDYWVIKAGFDASCQSGGSKGSDGYFEATHQTARFKSEAEAQAVMTAVRGASSGVVSAIEKKRRTVPAPVPFNTTSLMAAAASEGISPARTMRIAESLYMDGYISYPRVDNTVYPSSLDLEGTVRKLQQVPVYAPYCGQLLKKGSLTATRGKQETTDHPPIHPTAAASPDKLDAASWKLYNLIARRFLATLSGPAIVEGTKVSIDVNAQTFVARGDVLVTPGFRGIYPYGLKKDEQLPSLQQGDVVAFIGASCDKKQTEPPARYSQGKLIQEMERLGLGTKATRHSIIERLYTVKYIQNDPIEPSQLGIAVCDALGRFASQITTPEMTATLEGDMNDIANGKKTQEEVVALSRDLLNDVLNELLPHADEVKEALGDAVAADAYIGRCPKCGKDLQIRTSQKTRSTFIGCSGWPECDVTYPLPKGKVEAVDKVCPVCGLAQVKVTPFRSKPITRCIDPNCPSNAEAPVVVGKCPACAAEGRDADLVASRNPRTLKRSIRCECYDQCQTSYPLPQYGDILATSESCESCGAPMVVVKTARGPWKLCPNPSCPSAEEAKARKAEAKAKKPAAKSKASKSRSTKAKE